MDTNENGYENRTLTVGGPGVLPNHHCVCALAGCRWRVLLSPLRAIVGGSPDHTPKIKRELQPESQKCLVVLQEACCSNSLLSFR